MTLTHDGTTTDDFILYVICTGLGFVRAFDREGEAFAEAAYKQVFGVAFADDPSHVCASYRTKDSAPAFAHLTPEGWAVKSSGTEWTVTLDEVRRVLERGC